MPTRNKKAYKELLTGIEKTEAAECMITSVTFQPFRHQTLSPQPLNVGGSVVVNLWDLKYNAEITISIKTPGGDPCEVMKEYLIERFKINL